MMKSMLTPEGGVTVGVLTAVGVYLIYENALPNLADIRVAQPHDNDIEQSRKHAAWKSAALVGLVFLVARDLNSYVISGAALVGIDYMHKHANAVNPATGKMDASGGGLSVAPEFGQEYSMPEYSETA